MGARGHGSLASTMRVLTLCSFVTLMPAWTGAACADEKKSPLVGLEEKAPGARITRGEAMQAALKSLPGKVAEIKVERKRGKQVYVIEIAADKDGSENDVFVDMQTGEVLGIEKQ